MAEWVVEIGKSEYWELVIIPGGTEEDARLVVYDYLNREGLIAEGWEIGESWLLDDDPGVGVGSG